MTKRKALKLKGGSLIEVVVALSLISILFVVGSGLWAQIDGYQSPDRLLRYRLRAREMIEQCESEQDLADLQIQVDGVRYQRIVQSLAEGLYRVEISVRTPDEKLLLERSKILYWHEN